MKKNTLVLGIGMLGIASILAGSVTYAASDTSTTRKERGVHGEAIHAALLANDYSAFKEAIAQAPRHADAPEITEAVFAKMVEAEKLRASGDIDGARAIMKELGFNVGPHGKGKRIPENLTDAQKSAWEKARTLRQEGKLEESQAVLKAAGIELPTPKMPENLTQTQQTAWTKAHELMQQGKRDEAKTLLDDAGIPRLKHGRNK